MSYVQQSNDRDRDGNSDPTFSGSHDGVSSENFPQVAAPTAPEAVTQVPTGLPALPEAPRARSIAERFEDFHRTNPHVYEALVRLARRFIEATGKRKLGAQRLIEIARWDLEIRTKGEDVYEINNDYAAFYARLVMYQEPDLAGVFDLRTSPNADRWIAQVRNGLVTL